MRIKFDIKVKLLLATILLVTVLLFPASSVEKNIYRYWDSDHSHEFLVAVEMGNFSFIRDKYSLDIFDNSTLNGYLSTIDNARYKPFVVVLSQGKFYESYSLDYTALALSGHIKLNATIEDKFLFVNLSVGDRNIEAEFMANETLLNSSGNITVGLNDSINLEMEGYVVFMSITYEYKAKPILPYCLARIHMLQQIFIFDNNNNIIFITTIFLTLLAK